MTTVGDLIDALSACKRDARVMVTFGVLVPKTWGIITTEDGLEIGLVDGDTFEDAKGRFEQETSEGDIDENAV